MMNRREFLVALFAASLVGCGRNEPIHQPTPLTPITPKLNMSKVWQSSVGKAGRRDVPGLQVIYYDERLFAAAGSGNVAALNVRGDRIWQQSLDLPLTAGPALSPVSELLYVGSAKGDVLALSDKTGEIKWRINIGSEVLSVVTVAGRIFVRTGDEKLISLDALNGQTLWVLDHDMPSLSVRGMAAPLPVSNALLLGWDDGFVEALLQENGERAWDARIALPRGRTEIERMVDVQSVVLSDGERVFAGATNNKVVALDLQSGNQLWASDVPTWVDMALGNRRLWVVAEDDTIKAIATDSGRILWQQDALKYRRLPKILAWNDWGITADMEGALHIINGQDGSFLARVEGAVSTALVDGVLIDEHRYATLDVDGNVTLWQVNGAVN